MVDGERQLGLDLAGAEEAQAVLGAAHDAGGDERIEIDRLAGVEALVVDRLLQRADVDLVEVLAAATC